jgi:PAS domain S-box-containing protein
MQIYQFSKEQQLFLKNIQTSVSFLGMLEALEGISFFVKDVSFRLIFANPYFFRRLGLRSEVELIGKDDFQLFPEPLARKFRKDDETIIQSGQPLTGLVELFLNQQGIPAWYQTNKFPVLDPTGQVFGIMGTVQRYEKSGLTVSMDSKVEILAKELRGEINNPVSIAKLAKKIGLSHRQLNRRFKEATGLSPQQFQVRVKIEKACKLLRDTEKALVEIGLELGFCDQSAFTAQFRKRMSMTPRQYRTQYGRKRSSES